jgi:serine protease Do
MQMKFFNFLVITLLLISIRSGVTEHQVFFRLATGEEPVLIDNSDFSKLAAETSKAVVDIQTESMKNVYITLPQFQRFFQSIDPRTGKALRENAKSSGSAVIITEDGYLLTCAHVVSNSDKITVQLPDYRKYKARIVSNYPELDLAILRIDDLNGRKLPYLRIGSIKDTNSGVFVAALGNALNLKQSFTDGHISAVRRRITSPTTNCVFQSIRSSIPILFGHRFQ